MKLDEKDAVRQAFFEFCAERNLNGWAVFTRLEEPPPLPLMGIKTEPTLAISYFTAMHWIETQPHTNQSSSLTMEAMANKMQEGSVHLRHNAQKIRKHVTGEPQLHILHHEKDKKDEPDDPK